MVLRRVFCPRWNTQVDEAFAYLKESHSYSRRLPKCFSIENQSTGQKSPAQPVSRSHCKALFQLNSQIPLRSAPLPAA